ncbi:ribbon-helix-helix domain-containing protein [Patescibacteria group bacterium]|nr:ribbon-helix-helix domain-containing protein [Patescibacteria group bacterium]
MSEDTVILGIRVTPTMKNIIEKYIGVGAYINISDFGREALREKIRREASSLLEETVNTEQP